MTESMAEELGGNYRFIMENGKPVMLTPKTSGKYIGKKVKLRTGIIPKKIFFNINLIQFNTHIMEFLHTCIKHRLENILVRR